MRVYVAGRVAWIRNVQAMQAALFREGHTITFDWTGPEGDTRTDWSKEPQRARELSQHEREAVLTADAVVLVGNGCDEGEGGLGCFIEVGMALAVGIDVIVVGPARESVFWYMPGVARVDTHAEVLVALDRGLGNHMHTAPEALLARARAEISRLRRIAWECAEVSGADLSDYDGPDHLVFDPSIAPDEVRELRATYDGEIGRNQATEGTHE